MKKRITIEGMTCNHCVKHVAEALNELPGVRGVEVNLEGKNALVELANEVSDKKLMETVNEVGYDAIKVETI